MLLFYETADKQFYFTSAAQNLSNQSAAQDFNNDYMVRISRGTGLSVWSHFPVELKCTHSQFFSVLPCPVDLIRKARAQIQQKQLYFNVTGIRFAEERILKWA